MPKVKCKLCKASVERDQAYRTNLQSFCDADHFKEYAYSKKPKPKSSNQNGWSETRKTIIASDGGKCRVCGTRQNLHVHHIQYRSEGGSDDTMNLITLCLEHHDLIHSNKHLYQERCFQIIEKRSTGDMHSRIKIGE